MDTQPALGPSKDRFADFHISCQHFAPGRTSRREPSGTQHLRRFGDAETACGLRAVEWPMYFDRAIDVRNPDLCRNCARGIGLRA